MPNDSKLDWFKLGYSPYCLLKNIRLEQADALTDSTTQIIKYILCDFGTFPSLKNKPTSILYIYIFDNDDYPF